MDFFNEVYLSGIAGGASCELPYGAGIEPNTVKLNRARVYGPFVLLDIAAVVAHYSGWVREHFSPPLPPRQPLLLIQAGYLPSDLRLCRPDFVTAGSDLPSIYQATL
jgi:hypothetical protein